MDSPLNSRPMLQIRLNVSENEPLDQVIEKIKCQLGVLPGDSVVQLKPVGEFQRIANQLSDRLLRQPAPETMNVSFSSNGRFRALK